MNLGNQGRKGFTLIELMVVIAIIGVLAGLILPVLNKARDSANKTTGISNLKQIGLSMRVYEDREGAFPPYNGDEFLGMLWVSKDVPDSKLFAPKGSGTMTLSSTTAVGTVLPGMAGYKNAPVAGTCPLVDWVNPSVCAIACDVGASGTNGPYGGGYTRCVLYQDGSAKPQGSTVADMVTVGAANGDTSGTTGKNLVMLQTN